MDVEVRSENQSRAVSIKSTHNVVKASGIPVFGKWKSFNIARKHRDFFLTFMDEMRDAYGNVVAVHLPFKRHLFFGPEHVDTIIKGSHRTFTKSHLYELLRPYQLNGPVMSEGDYWINQRRLTAPDFMARKMEDYAKVMSQEIQSVVKQMDPFTESHEPLNLVPYMNQITFNVVCKSVMGEDLGEHLDQLYKEICLAITLIPEKIYGLFLTPYSIPTPLNMRIKNSGRRFYEAVYKILEKSRLSGSEGMLGRLMKVQEKENLSDKEIAEIVGTMLLAGFETTSNAISWSLYLLAQNPDQYAELIEENESVLSGRPVTFSDLAQLKYNRMVIEESMRLYPPIPLLGRKNAEDIEINGETVPAESNLDFCIWSIQRHPDFWPRATEFLPSRFSDEERKKHHPGAYLPFALGPRECQGKNFALIELQLILANLTQKFKIKLAPGFKLVPEVGLVLRPKNGIQVLLQRRA